LAISKAGSQAKLADLVAVKSSYLSQIKNTKHPTNMGSDVARRIEAALSLPHGWMDQLHNDSESRSNYHNPSIDPIQPLLGDMSPTVRRKIPIISYVQAGNWCTLVDNFAAGDADDWVETSGKYSATAYALRVHGSSMEPTIQENAIIIVDPQEEWEHNKIVVVRQNGDAEVTVKRIVKDGSSWLLKPDNTQFPIMKMLDDAHVCGVVKEMVVRF
jgi:SOS-response transcriptional repressor LexA